MMFIDLPAAGADRADRRSRSPASAAGIIGARSQKLFVAQWRNTGELNGQIEESFSGHDLVKVFGRHADMLAALRRTNDELYKASFGAQFVSGMIMPVMMFVGNLSYVAIAVVGGLRVASGAMSLGDVQAFIQYSRQFTQPLTQMAVDGQHAAVRRRLRRAGLRAARRRRAGRRDRRRPPPGQDRRRASRFEHVSFSYTPDKPLIEDLSFVAEPGHTVAIVGPTGAGKTTLVNLIMRFYELDAGRITLDGVDITSSCRAELRARSAWCCRTPGCSAARSATTSPTASRTPPRSRSWRPRKATFVDRFVHALPDGYDTVIDEEGNNVSAGEKQLITIARAFLADPSLLILDEATSSVDTRTEVLVQQAMAALRTDRTSFVIAHRLSTIRDADLILVMEDGRIVEQGTHDELLRPAGRLLPPVHVPVRRGGRRRTSVQEEPTAVHS